MIAELTTLHQLKIGFDVAACLSIALFFIAGAIDYRRWRARQEILALKRELQVLKHESEVFQSVSNDVELQINGVLDYVERLLQPRGRR